MIFDMLKSLRSVVYLPGDYVCKKVHTICKLDWTAIDIGLTDIIYKKKKTVCDI